MKELVVEKQNNAEDNGMRKNDLTNEDIISLWCTVRFPLLTKEFVQSTVIQSDQFGPYISQTESFLAAASLHQYMAEGKRGKTIK